MDLRENFKKSKPGIAYKSKPELRSSSDFYSLRRNV
jgi:hypothetical protein